MRLLALLTLCIVILASNAKAQEYETGTVGDLYQDCMKTVQVSTLEETANSRCYQLTSYFLHHSFTTLYVLGHTGSQYFNENFSEECRAKAEQRHSALMGSLACDNLDHAMVQVPFEFAYSFMAWSKWASEYKPEIMNKNVAYHIEDMILPGEYCDYIKGKVWYEGLPDINAALKQYDKGDYKRVRALNFYEMSNIEKYKNCETAIKISESDNNAFLKTQCGTAVQAQLAAQNYLRAYTYFPRAFGECSEEINKIGPDDKLRNIMGAECEEKISELEYAKLFISKYKYESENNALIVLENGFYKKGDDLAGDDRPLLMNSDISLCKTNSLEE